MAVDTNQSWMPDWLSGLLGNNGDSAANSLAAGAQASGYDPQAIAAWYGQKPQSPGGLGAGLGANVGTGQLALTGLGALSSLFNANKQNKLAQEQFDFQKNVTNTNLNNQVKTYNTALEDRLTSRGVAQGQTTADVQDQIARNRLVR